MLRLHCRDADEDAELMLGVLSLKLPSSAPMPVPIV
jgi:hypothetical protein